MTTRALLFCALLLPLPAANLHLSPTGNDTHPGTSGQPLATLTAARDLARKSDNATIIVHAGIYYLPETLVLDASDSGTTFRAADGDPVILSGGINISEGTFGGHLIEGCDVFDTVRETGDHGSFNSWGRDRFWGLKDVPDGKLPDLALLDAVETTVIRNSRWRCDHGWDVDLDDGSSNYLIENNLFLNGGLKLREGFHRTVRNEFSAFGVSKGSGGVHLTDVPKDSQAAAAGLKTGDLIQQVNGKPAPNFAALLEQVAAASGKPLKLTVIRGQKPREIPIAP